MNVKCSYSADPKIISLDCPDPIVRAADQFDWPRAKLTPMQAAAIRRSKRPGTELSRRYRISQATITNIRLGLSWRKQETTL